MTKTIPSYLRLHRGPARSSTPTPASTHDNVDNFWDAYSEVTGWRIDPSVSRNDQPMQLLPAVTIDVMDGADTQSTPAVSRSSAMRLAKSASRLADQLCESREALRRQEAELAARAATVVGEETRGKLADKIEKTLADAVATCRCTAAAMYLLDDDTQHLKARAVFGLHPSRLEQPPRELRGSRGDLEALIQGVVTVDDLHAGPIDSWNSPEPFTSGICAAICQDDLPIGTLWLFSQEPREFAGSDSAAARLAASQLALELSRAASGRKLSEQKQGVVAVRDIAEWQYQSLPAGSTLAERWHVDGMIESPSDWVTGWHTWDVLPDGSLLLAMAEAVDSSVMGAMTAAVARGALAAHCGYRHTPKQLLQRVSDTLWQTSTGEQLVSMLYARVDPETGEGEIAGAGRIAAMIGSRYGYRPLLDGRSEPLTSHIDSRSNAETFRMMPGESLLTYGPGVIADGATQMMIGESIRTSMREANGTPLSVLRRQLARHGLGNERGLATLTRS